MWFRQFLLSILFLLVNPFVSVVSAQSSIYFTKVDTSHVAICGVTNDHRVICNVQSHALRYLPPEDLPPAIDVSLGGSFICALLLDGNIQCWGDDDFGVLDVPADGAPYQSVSTGEAHACAIDRDNALVCWGLSSNGRLDAPSGYFTQVDAGNSGNCAIDSNGTVHCWGNTLDEESLRVPADLPAALQVALARHTTCAILTDGSLRCWGIPVVTPPLSGPYSSIALDYYTSSSTSTLCLLDPEGSVDCRFYQLGLQESLVDADDSVPSSSGFTDIAVVDNGSACGVNASGVIECWGEENKLENSVRAPSIDGSDMEKPPRTTGLKAEVYSDSTAELLWDAPRAAYKVAGHEILRNGEVSAFTENLSSYLVTDLVSGTAVEFAVRRVSNEGVIGDASDPVIVNTTRDNGSYQPPARPFEPEGLTAKVYSPRSLELFWEKPEQAHLVFQDYGYEIRRNGEFRAFVTGNSFYDETPATDRHYRYDVIAVKRSDIQQILGFNSIIVALGDADEELCR